MEGISFTQEQAERMGTGLVPKERRAIVSSVDISAPSWREPYSDAERGCDRYIVVKESKVFGIGSQQVRLIGLFGGLGRWQESPFPVPIRVIKTPDDQPCKDSSRSSDPPMLSEECNHDASEAFCSSIPKEMYGLATRQPV